MFQTSRSNLISIAKGICIILMVIGHSGCQRDVFSFIYFFHMPLFFFVSGFFFSIDKVCNLESYIVRKIKALWLPFLKWSLIFLAAHNLFYRIHFVNSAFTIVDYLKQLCLIPFMYGNDELIGGFWFLNNLFYTTIFVAIFCRIAQNRMPNDSKLSLLVFTVSFLLFLLGLSIYDKSGHVAAREFVSLTYAMTCFCLGYVANSKRIFSSSYTHEHINEAPNNTIENMKFLAMGGVKSYCVF